MDANEMHEEKDWWERHKNATCCFEIILEATYHKIAAVRPPTSHLINHPRKIDKNARHLWRSKDEGISNAPVLADQQRLTCISLVRTLDVFWRTCEEQWMMRTDVENQGIPCCQHDFIITIIIIIIVNLFLTSFSQNLTGGFSLNSVCQQSSQLSSTLQCILVDFNTALAIMLSILSLIFRFPGLFPRAFGDPSKCSKSNWHHHHLYVLQLFKLSSKDQIFVHLFTLLYFHSVVCWNSKSTRWQVFSCFSLTYIRLSHLTRIGWFTSHSKSQIILCVLFSKTDSGLYIYYLSKSFLSELFIPIVLVEILFVKSQNELLIDNTFIFMCAVPQNADFFIECWSY